MTFSWAIEPDYTNEDPPSANRDPPRANRDQRDQVSKFWAQAAALGPSLNLLTQFEAHSGDPMFGLGPLGDLKLGSNKSPGPAKGQGRFQGGQGSEVLLFATIGSKSDLSL